MLRVIGVLAVAMVLVAPTQALGKTYCVHQVTNPAPPPPCDGGTTADLQPALTAAQGNAGADTVRISAGTFIASPDFVYNGTSDPVTILGAGPATRLTRSGPGNVLKVSSTPQSNISDLTVVPPAGTSSNQSVGIQANNAKITSVIVDPSGATGYVTGFDLNTGELNDVTALLSTTGTQNVAARIVGTSASAIASVDGSSLSGEYGLLLTVPDSYVTGTRITGRQTGLRTERNLSVSNTQIRVTPAGANQFGLVVDSTSNATVFARHVTIVGDGGTGSSAGLYARAFHLSGPAINVQVYANSTIVRGFTSSFARVASPPGPNASATITPTYSNFPPNAAGSYTPHASNLDVDPLFADAPGGDFRLAAGSPVIDRGSPQGIIGGEGPDLAGNPRVVDGNGDGSAIRDIGAFEFQPPPPQAPPGGTTPGGTTPGGTIAPGGSPSGPGGATGITALALAPRRFLAATGGPAVTAAGKAKAGALVSFTLSQPGPATFAVEKRTSGRRSKGKCVKATRKNRKARKCARYVAVKKSAFTREGSAGANAFRLTGRLGRRALAPASYRLVAAAGATQKTAAFTVKRPPRRRR